MEDSKDEDLQFEVTRNLLIDVEDEDKQDDFSEFIWNEIESGVSSSMTEAHRSTLLRHSPEPECAICLETIEDKGVANSCFHSFCFLCLQKWSEIKAECPLCKQPFKSILHNIRSIDDYDQYHIMPKNADMSWRPSPDFNSEFLIGGQNYHRLEDSFQLIAYEMIHASHSVNFPTERNLFSENPSTISFRKRIYENGLWVKPFRYENVQHHRINCAEFYRRYPQYISRLRPWLNRELFALLGDRQRQIPFVLDLILSLVTRYDVRSEEFFFHIVPYFQHRTSHFVHEFFNFATSLYEMDRYDHCAIYENLVSERGCNAVPYTAGCDVNPVTSSTITFSDNSPSVCIIYASGSSCLSGRNTNVSSERQQEHSSRNYSFFPVPSWSIQSTPECSASSFQRFPEQDVFPAPSETGIEIDAQWEPESCLSRGSVAAVHFPAGDDSSSSVGIMSPTSLCTPELVDLVSSSSEDENVCASTVSKTCKSVQMEESSGCTSLNKKHQKEEVMRINMDSSRKMFTSSLLAEVPNVRRLTPDPQCFGSVLPHENVSPSTSVSANKVCCENGKTFSGCLSSCAGITCSSPLTDNDTVALHFSSASADSSETMCNSGKTCTTSKGLSLCSHRDLPISFSSSVNQTSNKNDCNIAMNSSIDKVPKFKSKSFVQSSENNQKECCKTLQQCSLSVANCSEESRMFKKRSTKRKLCSVVCVPATSDEQSSHSGHCASCHKRHKKKQTKHKHHRHHKCSHSSSLCSHHVQKCEKCKGRKRKKVHQS